MPNVLPARQIALRAPTGRIDRNVPFRPGRPESGFPSGRTFSPALDPSTRADLPTGRRRFWCRPARRPWNRRPLPPPNTAACTSPRLPPAHPPPPTPDGGGPHAPTAHHRQRTSPPALAFARTRTWTWIAQAGERGRPARRARRPPHRPRPRDHPPGARAPRVHHPPARTVLLRLPGPRRAPPSRAHPGPHPGPLPPPHPPRRRFRALPLRARQRRAAVLAAEHGIEVRRLGYRADKALEIAHSQRRGHTVGVNGSSPPWPPTPASIAPSAPGWPSGGRSAAVMTSGATSSAPTGTAAGGSTAARSTSSSSTTAAPKS
jgi:hypothetical protein